MGISYQAGLGVGYMISYEKAREIEETNVDIYDNYVYPLNCYWDSYDTEYFFGFMKEKSDLDYDLKPIQINPNEYEALKPIVRQAASQYIENLDQDPQIYLIPMVG